MAISVSNANILFKDKSGNVGKVNTLTDNDIAKLSNGLQTIENHTTSLSTLTSSINRVNDKFADYSTTSEVNAKFLAITKTKSSVTSASANITINENSNDNILLSTASTVTVSNGSSGTAWTKCVKIVNASSTISFGSSWSWVGGEAPELSANCILILKWLGDFGLANVISASA